MAQRAILFGLNLILAAGSLSVLVATNGLNGLSRQALVVLAFAWIGVFSSTRRLHQRARIGKLDIVLVLLIAALSLSPGRLMYVSVLAYAAYLVYRFRECSAARHAALVLFSIVAAQALAPLAYSLLENEFNTLDAFLVEKIFAPEIVRDGTILFRSNGHAIEIYSECSSFHNISQGLLFWAATMALGRHSINRTDYLVGLSTAALLLVINVSRLCLLGLDHDSYIYWHDEYGRQIYSYVFAGGMVSLPLLRLWFSRESEEGPGGDIGHARLIDSAADSDSPRCSRRPGDYGHI